MAVFALTIFLSAFLLFLVQPVIARYILPWLGGGPTVWTTCLLFFQLLLLAGYGYAHLLSQRVPARTQAWLHVVLLAASLLVLPIAPAPEVWKPMQEDEPTGRILVLLLANVGPPFLLLSSTAPLLQCWVGATFLGGSTYRLYALSNAGSLLALLSYPFLLEPLLRLPLQAKI